MQKCCREKGVIDVCFGYCETSEDKPEKQAMARQGPVTGICEKWFEIIGKCAKRKF